MARKASSTKSEINHGHKDGDTVRSKIDRQRRRRENVTQEEGAENE